MFFDQCFFVNWDAKMSRLLRLFTGSGLVTKHELQ